MFGIILYDILFFAVPTILIVLFGISLYRYISARNQNRAVPGTYSDAEIKNRKMMLLVTAVIAGVLAVVVIGFIVILFMAVAFM